MSNMRVISSGMSSLDATIGGGLPPGSITLVQEDDTEVYSKIMLKYFVAEGIVSKHSIFLASQDTNPNYIIHDLPAVVPKNDKSYTQDKIEMKIAFRYERLRPTDLSEDDLYSGNNYDISKTMPPEKVDEADILCWTASAEFANSPYDNLLQSIKNKIEEKKSTLRIAIHSLGSPLWMNAEQGAALVKFIYSLRTLVKTSNAVVLITMPSAHLLSKFTVKRITHSCDMVFRLEAFAGTELESNKSLTNYHGFFHIIKVAPINSFASRHPGSVEYAFKLRRKKFNIEVLHLPPDFHELDQVVKTGCGGSNLLEF